MPRGSDSDSEAGAKPAGKFRAANLAPRAKRGARTPETLVCEGKRNLPKAVFASAARARHEGAKRICGASFSALGFQTLGRGAARGKFFTLGEGHSEGAFFLFLFLLFFLSWIGDDFFLSPGS